MFIMATKTLTQIIEGLEKKAPSATAEDWDNVGLLIGNPQAKIQSALVSIDLTHDVIDLALKKKTQLIVNHHPCIFPKGRGPSRVLAGSPLYRAIKEEIAVCSYHTNFDVCALEVVGKVSAGLDVRPMGRLFDSSDSALTKLSVFVPSKHLEQVRGALTRAGAGHIGNYGDCTFASVGEGTFRGSNSTKPFIGKPGKLEKTKEHRLETVFPSGLRSEILSALASSHPYEEVAYDLYPVLQVPGKRGIIRGLGYGFWGEFQSPKPFSDVARRVTSLFGVKGFLLTEPAPKRVKRVAFVAGKGSGFVDMASNLGCELMISGEVGYHSAVGGAKKSMAVMEIGHRESERFFLSTMEEWLAEMGLKIWSSDEPLQRIWSGDKL